MSYIKKVICIVIILSVLCALFWGCNNKENNNRKEKPDLHESCLPIRQKTKRNLCLRRSLADIFSEEGQEIVPQTWRKNSRWIEQNQDKIYGPPWDIFVSEGFMGYLSAVVSVLSVLSKKK